MIEAVIEAVIDKWLIEKGWRRIVSDHDHVCYDKPVSSVVATVWVEEYGVELWDNDADAAGDRFIRFCDPDLFKKLEELGV